MEKLLKIKKERNRNLRTDLLFSKVNFSTGMGTVLNLAGNFFMYNYSESDELADVKAISSDWGMIGKDIWAAFIELQIEDIDSKTNNALTNGTSTTRIKKSHD